MGDCSQLKQQTNQKAQLRIHHEGGLLALEQRSVIYTSLFSSLIPFLISLHINSLVGSLISEMAEFETQRPGNAQSLCVHFTVAPEIV